MTTFLKNRDMKFSFHLLLACIALTACGESGKTTADYRIVPCPGEIAPGDGGDFELDARTRIVCTGDNDGMRANAEFLAGYVESVVGSAPEITGPDGLCDDGRAVILRADAPGKGGEAYEIEVSENRITVSGESDAGVFYGIQTLRKAMGAAKAAKVLFPAVRIADEPYLGYRGVMLDVGRTFYPVEEVKRIIDLAALHNLNVFHWHLTDDQGWRIEIDAYPRLTETGAFRRDTTLAGEPGTFGGYYTKRQIRDIVEYAARRYIEVVPEIDMPGHMTAALASYPELGCTGGPYVITSQPGVRRDILCAGNPAVFDFVEKVLEEVIGLFPSKYIHIGGDESPRTRWRECPECQSLIRRAGLKADTHHSAEDKLQGYFNTRIEEFLARHGRRLIGWDEIVDGGMSPDATVMSWRGTAGGIRAADEGFDVIMSPNSSLYFDYYQSANIDTEPPTIGGYIPLKKVYDTEPVPEELTPEQARHIIGVQANVWTTYMRTDTILEHMLLPRLAALAERAWSDREKDFTARRVLRPRRLQPLPLFLRHNRRLHRGLRPQGGGDDPFVAARSGHPLHAGRQRADGRVAPLHRHGVDRIADGGPGGRRPARRTAQRTLPRGGDFQQGHHEADPAADRSASQIRGRRAQRRPAGQAGLHLRQLGGLAGRRHGGRDRPRTAGGDRAGGVQRPAGLRVAHHGRRRSEGMGFGRRRNIPRGIRRALSGNSLRCRQTHFAPRSELLPGAPGPLRETAGHALQTASRSLFRPESASVSVYRRNLRILAVWIHADSNYARPPSEFSP